MRPATTRARLQAKLALAGLAPPPASAPALDGLTYLAEHAATRAT
ncbi:MAG: hypothetical protein ACRDYX_01070 [Egibacteraceae bacterium]